MRLARSGERIAAETPPERDRYLDALRVLAVLFVVSGHWLVRVIVETGEGLQGAYLLNLRPDLQWATLLWQVMPVFFFVGGAVNIASWRRARAAGESASRWVCRRVHGLLTPALLLIAVLVPLAALVEGVASTQALVFDFGVAVFPMWFLAVYILVTALVPVTVSLHRCGRGWHLLLAGGALAIVLDLLRFAGQGPTLGTQPAVAAPNFLIVWVLVHQAGYYWADGALAGRGAALIGAGGMALIAMIAVGPWPLSMVPFEGTARANNGAPPSTALLALGAVQLGIAILLREPVGRWLKRPLIWAPVALIGAHIMAVYLWHQPAMVAVANLAVTSGWLVSGTELDADWWAGRLGWVFACGAVLLPLAVVAARVGNLWRPADSEPGDAITGLGVALVCGGLAGLIGVRLVQSGMPLNLPLVPLAAVLAGAAMLGVFTRRAGRAG